jgi:ubiquinone/menaquinone biosynthesis C-methylase UbiE
MAENERIQWVYSSKTNRELEERYDQWATDYDSDLGGLGWTGPRAAAEVLARVSSPDAKVLDAGAGTGLVGVELKKLSFNDITAIDISNGMLEVANQTGAYRAVKREVLGEPLGYETDEFDAVISVGTLTIGHAPPSSLDELIRVTKPGGKIVFSMRPDHFEPSGFKAKQEALEAEGKWKLLERGQAFHPIAQEPDVEHEVWVYEVLP